MRQSRECGRSGAGMSSTPLQNRVGDVSQLFLIFFCLDSKEITAMDRISHPPHAVAGLSKFTFSLAQEDVDALNRLLRRPLPIATWENSSQPDERFGISRDWLAKAISEWQSYDWQAHALAHRLARKYDL